MNTEQILIAIIGPAIIGIVVWHTYTFYKDRKEYKALEEKCRREGKPMPFEATPF